MSTKAEAIVKPGDREIVISRVFDAQVKRVWEAFADTEQVVKWWGPIGFTTTVEKREFKDGGVWQHVMKGPDGTQYLNKAVFKKIVEHKSIEFSVGGGRVGDDGKVDDKGMSFMASWTFEAMGEKTKVTMRTVFISAEERDNVIKKSNGVEGGKQTLGRLADYLSAGTDFVITRMFDAPRDLVWKAFTEPERMAEWFGPKGVKCHSVKYELKPGGINHYCMTMPDGAKMWGKTAFREIVAPEMLVYVNSFSDEKAGLTRHPMSATWPLELLTTITFLEVQCQTAVSIRWRPINATSEEQKTFDSSHDGMTKGWGGSLDQLADYLTRTK